MCIYARHEGGREGSRRCAQGSRARRLRCGLGTDPSGVDPLPWDWRPEAEGTPARRACPIAQVDRGGAVSTGWADDYVAPDEVEVETFMDRVDLRWLERVHDPRRLRRARRISVASVSGAVVCLAGAALLSRGPTWPSGSG